MMKRAGVASSPRQIHPGGRENCVSIVSEYTKAHITQDTASGSDAAPGTIIPKNSMPRGAGRPS
jgi:hypothetical protein